MDIDLRSPLTRGFQRLKMFLKGSWKDPFLYLGSIAAILLTVSTLSFAFGNAGFPGNGAFAALSVKEFYSPSSFLIPKQAVKESPDLFLIQKNSLAAVSPAITINSQVLGAIAVGAELDETQKEIIEYAVEPGDNLWTIASKFNISLNTILWANEINQNAAIQVGQKLVIPPVSGVIYHVQKNDTISAVAQTYKGNINEIIAFNDLSAGGAIFIGDILIIPNGTMPSKAIPQSYIPLASSYFMCPLGSSCRLTQRLHWYNAVDFSNGNCGSPIYASAAGNVLKVALTNSRSKWANGGSGNYITILHPNGVVTYYGHLQTTYVNVGDYVSQGRVIASMGGEPGMIGAGNSTGCHVHFGVRGAANPFAR
ncbi:MAG: LysM peptidoglycan-binding domain-containing protein [Candidatus Parcubacteria bacterium]|nr:LysM peptidoglycan-binding domain-containing protein [Candidatus Parcubacteria bacterium]